MIRGAGRLAAVAVFGGFAALQLNDPDPGLWIGVYLAAAVVLGAGRWLPRAAGALLAAGAGLWAVTLAAAVAGRGERWVDEAGREAGGLLLVALVLGVHDFQRRADSFWRPGEAPVG